MLITYCKIEQGLKVMQQIEITIDPRKKQVSFPVPSTDFVPGYLKYLLEYKDIPNTYKLIFTDRTFNNLKEAYVK